MANSTYTSTSQIVKTRPRRKPGAPVKPKEKRVSEAPKLETVPEKPLASTRKKIKTEPQQAEPERTFQPMALVHYDELSAIWPADRRIPSVASRRAWALARNLKPDVVHRWWYRRRLVAKRARLTIPKDSYELDIGTPPTLVVVVKDEEEEKSRPKKKLKLNTDDNSADNPDLEHPRSPCSTFYDSILPSSDAISNTSISDATSTLGKRAYTRSLSSPARSCSPTFDFEVSSPIQIRYSPLPPSSPPPPASPADSDEELGRSSFYGLTLDNSPSELQLDERPQVHCNQGLDENSDFTCSLCSQAHTSLPEDRPTDISLPYAIPLPQTLESLWLMVELSAIPYLTSSYSHSQVQARQADANGSVSFLPDVPTHDYEDPRLEPQHEYGIWRQCLGGNKYSYDGFFIGRCGCPCVDSRAVDETGAELWDFGSVAPLSLASDR